MKSISAVLVFFVFYYLVWVGTLPFRLIQQFMLAMSE
jgi:hypothetical protein